LHYADRDIIEHDLQMMKNAKWRDFQEGDTIYEEGRDVYVLNFIVQVRGEHSLISQLELQW
jgi:hypothetical protein